MKGHFASLFYRRVATLRKRHAPAAIRTPGRTALAARERTVAKGHFKPAHCRIVPDVAFHLLPPSLISGRILQARLRRSAGHSPGKRREPCVWTNGDGLWIRGAMRGLTLPPRRRGPAALPRPNIRCPTDRPVVP